MSVDAQSPAPVRIELADDVLISDEEFCALVLAGIHRRTARRYEREGLPFVMVGGKKFRPSARGGLGWPDAFNRARCRSGDGTRRERAIRAPAINP